MNKRVLSVLAVLLSVAAVPAVAFAGPGGTFSGEFFLDQVSPGTITPVLVGPVQVGVDIDGEVFTGTIGDCGGCGALKGADMTIVQDATLLFDPPTPAGAVPFSGPVSGEFTISTTTGNKTHQVSGTYVGSVSGTLIPLGGGAFQLDDENVSTWTVTVGTATGKFNSMKDASGTIDAELGGVFPGFETVRGTLSGTRK